MDLLHVLVVENKDTYQDRTEFVCRNDPRWYDRPAFMLNKLLRHLSYKVRLSSVLESDIPCAVADDVDAIIMHIDVSVNTPQVVEWAQREAAKRPVINGFSDLSKRAVDAHRPPGFDSIMLPSEAVTGWAFVKSNYNYPQAPEEVYERLRVEDLQPHLRARSDLVVQHWIEDYRTKDTGLNITV